MKSYLHSSTMTSGSLKYPVWKGQIDQLSPPWARRATCFSSSCLECWQKPLTALPSCTPKALPRLGEIYAPKGAAPRLFMAY